MDTFKKLSYRSLSVLFSLFLLLGFSNYGHSQETSPKEEDPFLSFFHQWDQTSIDVQMINTLVNNENCYTSSIAFWGCFEAVKDIINLNSKGTQTVQLKQEDPQTHHDQLVESFGDLEVVTINKDRLPSPQSPQENYELFQSLRKRQKQIQRLSETASVDFDKIIENYFQTTPKEFQKAISASAFVTFAQNTYDSHFDLMLSEDFHKRETDQRDGGVGIGILVSQEFDQTIVGHVYKSGPANKSGLMARDIILQVDGEPIEGKDLSQITGQIRGEEGSQVTLLVKRQDQLISLNITRASYAIKNVETSVETSLNNEKVFVVRIENFMQKNLCQEFTQEISRALQEESIRNVVVDLRGNMGGQLVQALCMAGAFVQKPSKLLSSWNTRTKAMDTTYWLIQNHIISERTAPNSFFPALSRVDRSSILQYDSETPHLAGLMKDRKLVVITNGLSASASEVFSGIIQDLELGVVIGSKTFGKGCIQEVSEISPTLYLKKTTARFHLPTGWSNQKIGITPDYPIFANPWDQERENYQLKEADIAPFSPDGVSRAQVVNLENQNKLVNCPTLLPASTMKNADRQLKVAVEAATCL